MNRLLFYVVTFLMVGVSSYAAYRLFYSSSKPSAQVKVNHDSNIQVKAGSGMRFSDSVTQNGGSVWNDPRLKDPGIGDIGKELKTSAEVENNLKVLTDLYDQGADEEFLKRLNELIAQNPNVKEYAALLGDYYYNDGDWANAETAVKRLIELDPQNMFARTSLGELLAIQGRYDDAIETHKQVLQMDSNNLNAMYGMVATADMKGQGQREAAISELEQMAKAGNGSAAIVVAEDMFQRDQKGAMELSGNAFKNDPTNPLVALKDLEIQAHGGNFPGTCESAGARAELQRSNAQKISAWDFQWQACLEIGNFDAAERAIRSILNLDSNNGKAQQALLGVNEKRAEAKAGKPSE